MAQNNSDSDEEFTGFNAEDITIDNDYIPDSDPDSDITVSSVQSGDISSLGEESGESGPDEIGEAEWSQNLGRLLLMILLMKVEPNCLMILTQQQQHHWLISSSSLSQKCLS